MFTKISKFNKGKPKIKTQRNVAWEEDVALQQY